MQLHLDKCHRTVEALPAAAAEGCDLYLMLSRNLLYTGLTRAKKLAIVIGASKAIAIALNQTHQQQRYTRLQQRLIQARAPMTAGKQSRDSRVPNRFP